MTKKTSYLPTPRNWQEWGEMFTDVQLWHPFVRHLCQQTGTAVAEQVEAGFPGSTAVFIADQKVVVRVFPPFLENDFYIEAEMYRLLGTRLDPYLPQLLAQGVQPDRLNWPYLIFSFKEGAPIRDVRQQIPALDQAAIAQELGWVLQDLHRTPFDDLQALDGTTAGWHAFIQKQQVEAVEKLTQRHTFSAVLLAEIASFLEEQSPAIMAVSEEEPLCLINGDLTEDHLLLNQMMGQWQMTALLDWADARVGKVGYEWVALWFGLCAQDEDLFRHILHTYNPQLHLDHHFRQQMMAYTLLHQFGPATIDQLRQKPGVPEVHTLAELMLWLWPPMVD